MLTMKRWSALTGICVITISCAQGKAFKSGDFETKPQRMREFSPDSYATDPGSNPRPIFRAIYKLNVYNGRDKELCAGEATLIGYSNYEVKQEGEAKCPLGLKIDLAEMMGGDGFKAPSPEEAKRYPFYGKVSRLSSLGKTKYSPPRTFVLGPVIQNVQDYTGFHYSENLHVSHISKKGEVQQGDGTLHVQVISAGGDFRPEGYPETFKKVLHWEMRAEGFQGVNKGEAMLYDRFEYYWSTSPIAIPMIRIRGAVSNFVDGPIIAALGGAVVGEITVELILKDHTQI